MYQLKNYIALFLLLLFVRVLIPETTVLTWHAHEHTQEELVKNDGFKLDAKHSHCQTDTFYNSPFSPALIASIAPLLVRFTDTYSGSHAFIWKFTFPNNTESRGPPAV